MNITWLSFTELEQIRHEHSIRQALQKTSIKRKISDEVLATLSRQAAHEVNSESAKKEKFIRNGLKSKCPNCGRMIMVICGNLISHRKQKNGRGDWCINNNAVDNEPIEVQIDSQK